MESGIYFITGKLGAGKSVLAVSKMFAYLRAGRKVASNLDLFFKDEHFLAGYHEQFTRVPDKPKADDLQALGHAYEGEYDEDKNGLIVLDECASWFNSRTWNDPDRQKLIEYIIHLRKYGWTVMFLVQSFDVVDKQARELVGEYVVHLYNSKKLPIARLLPIKWHIASVYYQMHGAETRVAVWHYQGAPFYKLYDTRQIFSPMYIKPNYQYPLPAHLAGKVRKNPDWSKFIKVCWFRWVPALAGGCTWIPYQGETI